NTPRAKGGEARAAAATASPTLMPLRFQGEIRLADLAQNLAVSFPTQLLAHYIPDKNVGSALATAFPTGVPISLRGTTTSPKIDYGDIGKRFVEAVGKSQLGNLIGGGKGDNNDKAGKPKDPLGGL